MKRSYSISRQPNRRGDRGYVLLYLLFLVAILAISLVTILPTIKFVIKRDQEQEMVHRGEQYRRAVRRYYRKMGSYPVNLDVLENTNDMRFLRKRYKDPMNHNQDFKVLTQIDLMKAMGTALSANGGIAGAQTLGQPIGGDASGTDANGANGTATADANSSGVAPVDPNVAAGQAQAGAGGGGSTGGTTNPPANGSGTTLPFTTISGQPTTAGAAGGAAIVGVASLSGAETIRIYNKKNHYKDWLFIYDPSTDRGGLLTGPYQPQLQTFGQQGLNGQNNGMPGFGPGMNPGMGTGGGMNNGLGPGMFTPGTSPGNQGIGMQH
jgi:type II secretory pathway pseudopilin PulG